MFDDLKQRSVRLYRSIGFVGAGRPSVDMRNSLAEYRAEIPPRFFFRAGLPDQVKWMAFIHELGHVNLHPPGSDDYDEASYWLEEPCAHQMAHILCTEYGVETYKRTMVEYGVSDLHLEGSEDALVGVMLERVRPALRTPDECPSWASPVGGERGKEAT